jgi:hypothetical protein
VTGLEPCLTVLALALAAPDTVTVRAVDSAPGAARLGDSVRWGAPQIRVPTGQGTARVWLVGAGDSVYVVALIPDTTAHWSDAIAVSLDTEGDRADAPQHDDFQWVFRRAPDSSVVHRGRAGRWDPPQGDPDWRLGGTREGAGWNVQPAELAGMGWCVVLRLDRGWLALPGTRAGMAFRIYDDAPSGWFSWPAPPPGMQAVRVEQQPALWAVVRPTAPAESSGAAPPGGPGTRP